METIAQLPAVLQFGAFGLLTIILIGVGIWVRSSLNRSQAFIEKVADSALAAKEEHARMLQESNKTLQALAERFLAQQASNTIMLEKLTTCMQQQNVDTQREQSERSKEHEEIAELLTKALNGRRKDAEAEVAVLKARGM